MAARPPRPDARPSCRSRPHRDAVSAAAEAALRVWARARPSATPAPRARSFHAALAEALSLGTTSCPTRPRRRPPPTSAPTPPPGGPMSTLLYRLGRWAATHAWRILGAWLVLLAVVGTLAATIGTPLTSQVVHPGDRLRAGARQLGREVPSAAGGFGRVVLSTDAGGPFSADQKEAVGRALATWSTVPHVERVVDPFAAQQQIAPVPSSSPPPHAARRGQGRAHHRPPAARRGQGPARRRRGPPRPAREGKPGRPVASPASSRRSPAARRRWRRPRQQLAEGEQQYLAGEQRIPGRRHRRGRLRRDPAGQPGRPRRRRPGPVRRQRPVGARRGPRPDPGDGRPDPRAAGVTAVATASRSPRQLEFIGPGEILGLTVAAPRPRHRPRQPRGRRPARSSSPSSGSASGSAVPWPSPRSSR